MRHNIVLASSLLAAALTGCRADTHVGGVSATPAASPFSLYTHCGINGVRIDDTYYVAEAPLSDGHGNPPAGWNNPYQQGTIIRTSPSTVMFSDPEGHRVTFRATSRQPVVCD